MVDGHEPGGDLVPPPSPYLQRIGATVGVAAWVLAAVTVVVHLRDRPAWVVASAIAALVVTAAGLVWVAFRRSRAAGASHIAALIITGLAGSALWGLLPGTASFLIVCIAMGGLGMLLAPRRAFLTGFLVLAAANIAYAASPKPYLQIAIGQDIGAAFVFAVGIFTHSSRMSQAAAHAAQAHAEDLLAQLRASQAAQAEAAALTERARLAREIHDILAHALSGLVLALDTMELLGQQADTDPAALDKIMEHVARGQRIARDGLADTRRAIAALRGDELPGPALLDRLVTETAAATGIKAVLTVTGEQRPLPPEIGLALYRTAQETLTNTAKYAGRNGRAELRLSYGDDDIELAVEDARSRDASPPPPGLTFGGYGLTGIRERAELLGGKLTAGPTETGFKVLLQLPTVPAADPVRLR